MTPPMMKPHRFISSPDAPKGAARKPSPAWQDGQFAELKIEGNHGGTMTSRTGHKNNGPPQLRRSPIPSGRSRPDSRVLRRQRFRADFPNGNGAPISSR